VEELKQRVATLEEQRATLLQNLIPEETLEDWQQEITVMEEERTNVTEIGQKLSSIEADRKLRASLQSKVEEAGVRINDLRAKVAEMEKTFSPQKLTQAENVYNTIRRERDELNRQWTDVSAELASYSSRLTIANNTYKSVTEQWKRKSELLKAQEKNGLTTALLDKFRRETIASLTPELSENASELISDITNGAYTEIIVDDDFNISVINSMGDSRSIGELSGGEESAVALSLRLAIGLLITGRSPEFLWMDEVLTAQDADRRSSMLETIRGLPYKQIIMVSHTEDAGDIADLTVTVIPDLKRGSTLEITSSIGGTHETQEDSE
jgi:exonuclease SbcC